MLAVKASADGGGAYMLQLADAAEHVVADPMGPADEMVPPSV